MDPIYRESDPILPRPLLYALAAVLIATVAFMAIMEFAMDTDMPSWSLPLTAVVFVLIIVIAAAMGMTVTIDGEAIRVSYAFRKVEVPLSEVIDSRYGELGAIRSYSAWNLKGVKHKAYMRIGEDDGVAMKLTGRRVLVVSSKDPEALCALLPKDETAGGEKEAE